MSSALAFIGAIQSIVPQSLIASDLSYFGKVTPPLAFEAQFEKTNMAEEQVIEVDETCAPKEPTVPRRDDGRRYLLALLSMTALHVFQHGIGVPAEAGRHETVHDP